MAKAADAQDQTAELSIGTRTDESRRDSRTLTFSQAQGYEAVPGPLKLEEMPPEARVRIWNAIYTELLGSSEPEPYDIDNREPAYVVENWGDIWSDLYVQHLNGPLDEWDANWHTVCSAFRTRIEQPPFNQVFDLIQYVLRHPRCPLDFVATMKREFLECRLAYTIDEGPPPTIIPSVTPHEGHAVVDALKNLRGAGLAGAESHLRKASERVNAGDWAGSVRESIHAIESVARKLHSNKPKNLKDALAALEKRGSLHPALKEALTRLYGFTSDEQGVRHALLDASDADVGMDEAVFMLGACASFASFLWRKHLAGQAP